MTRSISLVIVALILALFVAGCKPQGTNGITQVATIDALLSGVYDGHMALGTLRGYGDFGIGTFAALDGEMILLDGTFYQARADGKIYQPAPTERTPFACVTTFVADHREALTTPMNLTALEAKLDALVPQQNKFCAVIVRGMFSQVRVRSVPAQKKPYQPLLEVTKNQAVFTLTNVQGALLGFRAPAFVKGVNIPGYHVHFLADDHAGGGHVLECEMTSGMLELDSVHEWLNIYLPTDSVAFATADLQQNRAVELQKVEKQ